MGSAVCPFNYHNSGSNSIGEGEREREKSNRVGMDVDLWIFFFPFFFFFFFLVVGEGRRGGPHRGEWGWLNIGMEGSFIAFWGERFVWEEM
jgi:hypothetical protein